MKRRDPPRQYLKRTSAEAGNDVVDGAKIQMYGMSMEKKINSKLPPFVSSFPTSADKKVRIFMASL